MTSSKLPVELLFSLSGFGRSSLSLHCVDNNVLAAYPTKIGSEQDKTLQRPVVTSTLFIADDSKARPVIHIGGSPQIPISRFAEKSSDETFFDRILVDDLNLNRADGQLPTVRDISMSLYYLKTIDGLSHDRLSDDWCEDTFAALCQLDWAAIGARDGEGFVQKSLTSLVQQGFAVSGEKYLAAFSQLVDWLPLNESLAKMLQDFFSQEPEPARHQIEFVIRYIKRLDGLPRAEDVSLYSSFEQREAIDGAWRDHMSMSLCLLNWNALIERDGDSANLYWRHLVRRELYSKRLNLPVIDPTLLQFLLVEELSLLVVKTMNMIAGMAKQVAKANNRGQSVESLSLPKFSRVSFYRAYEVIDALFEAARDQYQVQDAIYWQELTKNDLTKNQQVKLRGQLDKLDEYLSKFESEKYHALFKQFALVLNMAFAESD